MLAMVCMPLAASAGPVLRSGESVSVDAGQMIDGDFYGAGGTVTISGTILGDALAAGGSVTVNAPVEHDVTIAGGTVQIHARIADDLRVAGGEVTIASEVGGDVVVFGGVVRILSTAEIKGDLLFFGGDLVVDGPVEGSVFSMSENARINAFVGGDLEVRTSGGVTLGDKATVQGDVVYAARNEMVRAQNAVVVGDVVREEMGMQDGGQVEAVVLSFLVLAFAALVALLVFRTQLTTITQSVRTSYGVHGLIGLGVFALTPLVAMLLMVSLLGVYVGIFLIILYALFLVAAWIMSSVVLGTYLMKLRTKRVEVNIRTVLVGVVAIELIALIPVLGPFLVFLLMLVVLGTMVSLAYHSIRN